VVEPAGTNVRAVFAGSSSSHAALVTAIDQTISFPTIPPQTYGASPIAPPATSSSGLAVSYSAAGDCAFRNNTVVITGAGSCVLTASQPGNGAYNPAPSVQTTFAVAPVSLTLTAQPSHSTIGTIPSLTYSLTGFVKGDNANDLTGSASCTTTATTKSRVGQYPITCTAGTLSSPNYVIGQTIPSVLVLSAALAGYDLIGADGSVYAEGPPAGSGHPGVRWLGAANKLPLKAPIVGAAFTPDKNGYWLVATDGGIFSYGDAGFHGSTGALTLNKPIVGMATTPDGGGYWLVASDGGIFAFGDARFHGSTGSMTLNKPIVGMAVTSDAGGYWLVAADGGIFAFGDAGYHGSAGGYHLAQNVVSMATTPDGRGYWMVTSGGDVFAFGSAPFEGDLRYVPTSYPVVGLVPTDDGAGYTVAGADGSVYCFGDAVFYGTLAGGPSHATLAAII
jgi:hypothetical protein